MLGSPSTEDNVLVNIEVLRIHASFMDMVIGDFGHISQPTSAELAFF